MTEYESTMRLDAVLAELLVDLERRTEETHNEWMAA